MPAFPLQPGALKIGLTIRSARLSKSSAPPIVLGNIQPGSIFWLGGVKDDSKRRDDRNDAGVFLILVGLGLILQLRPPEETERRMLRTFPSSSSPHCLRISP